MGSISKKIFFEHGLTPVKYHSILTACQEIFASLDTKLEEGTARRISLASSSFAKAAASLSGGPHEAAVPHCWLGFFAVRRYGSCGERAHDRIRAGERD